jgi:tetratricopeptide (TPR) repeat protein
MIVKNESKNIVRLLDSVYKFIDCYCICDTGSTDNTINIIKKYFKEKNIPGKIVVELFKNFEHNRTFALKQCSGMADYILLLDADMIFQIGNFNKATIHDCELYYIFQGNDDFYYQNARIVKNGPDISYLGVTHEYLNFPNHYRKCIMPKESLFILDIGDGGCKANKFERDIELLEKGIKDDPTNVRYYFYLANSYLDSGNREKAIECYQKRIELGSWNQEVWYSYYKIGLIYETLKKYDLAIYNWLKCSEILPNRIENLYEITKFYKNEIQNNLALMFYKLAKEKIKNQSLQERESFLFLKNDVYTHKLDYEFSIIACYVGIKNINEAVINIMNHASDDRMIQSTLSNMKYYKDKLVPKRLLDLTNQIEYKGIKFMSSSSSIIPFQDGYKLNIRYVNYYIEPNGSYLHCDKHVITINKCVLLDKQFGIVSEKLIETDFVNRRYIGIEDVKIFKDKFIGTGFHENNQLGLCYGSYDDFSFHELKSGFNNKDCEKNWSLYSSGDDIHVVYQWQPLLLCKIENNLIQKICEKQMPKIFKHLRGSTNGFSYKDEIWFVTHLVSYESPRHYYHVIVVFDSNMELLRYSAPFKFDGEPIEYCLGIIVEDDNVILTYSTWDRTTKIAIYDKNYIFSKVNIYANIRV